VPKTPFVWKAELGGAPDSAFSAQLGSVTYYAVTRSYGHPAYIEVRGARRGLKRLDLGTYVKLEQAKQACERHYRHTLFHKHFRGVIEKPHSSPHGQECPYRRFRPPDGPQTARQRG
jgi:hypothetical protein